MTETAEAPQAGTDDLMEKVGRLCRHRGFIFPSAEIYGGFRSTYDYGPLGVNMLRNVKNAWWRAMVQERDDVVGLDAAILGPPAVWAASDSRKSGSPSGPGISVPSTPLKSQSPWRSTVPVATLNFGKNCSCRPAIPFRP